MSCLSCLNDYQDSFIFSLIKQYKTNYNKKSVEQSTAAAVSAISSSVPNVSLLLNRTFRTCNTLILGYITYFGHSLNTRSFGFIEML